MEQRMIDLRVPPKGWRASLARSRPKDGVASLAYSRPKDGVASLAYSRPKDGVASLAYGRPCTHEPSPAIAPDIRSVSDYRLRALREF
jgi:hypothetical protein